MHSLLLLTFYKQCVMSTIVGWYSIPGGSLSGMAVDTSNNVYFSSVNGNQVRVLTHESVLLLFAGTGTAGSTGDGGPAISAQLSSPTDLAVDKLGGNLYIACVVTIRLVTLGSGIITTYAGTGVIGSSGDGGDATSAQFKSINGLAVDNSGNVYIADGGTYKIRMVNSAGIITFVVSNTGGGGFALDGVGNIYIASGNGVVKFVTSSGLITTYAGASIAGSSGDGGFATSARLHGVTEVALDTQRGNLYIFDHSNYKIRLVTLNTSIITTYAGSGVYGSNGDGVAATSAQLGGTFSRMAVDTKGNLILHLDLLTHPNVREVLHLCIP